MATIRRRIWVSPGFGDEITRSLQLALADLFLGIGRAGECAESERKDEAENGKGG